MKPRILIQLDPDAHASVFDAVVAADSEVDHLLQYSNVRPEDVEGLVHGTMFTRGPADLKNTAIFIGGNQVQAGEELLKQVRATFFGPMRVSVMLDANGANTTAAAAVLSAARRLELDAVQALVLGGTGPVGQRAARLLLGQGARVHLASRTRERAATACDAIASHVDAHDRLLPCQVEDDDSLHAALAGCQLVIAAGAAGVQLLPKQVRDACPTLRLAIDLNAVPPVGIEGIDVMDTARVDGDVTVYGAIGVGGTKMKIHKAALRKLFEDNQQILDAESIYAVGESMIAS